MKAIMVTLGCLFPIAVAYAGVAPSHDRDHRRPIEVKIDWDDSNSFPRVPVRLRTRR